MEAAEEAAGATHVVADGLVRRLLGGIEGGDALKECVLTSGDVLIEDAVTHPEPVVFVIMVVKEDGKDLVRE